MSLRKVRDADRKRIGRVSYYRHHGGWHVYYLDDAQQIRRRARDTAQVAAKAHQKNLQLAVTGPALRDRQIDESLAEKNKVINDAHAQATLLTNSANDAANTAITQAQTAWNQTKAQIDSDRSRANAGAYSAPHLPIIAGATDLSSPEATRQHLTIGSAPGRDMYVSVYSGLLYMHRPPELSNFNGSTAFESLHEALTLEARKHELHNTRTDTWNLQLAIRGQDNYDKLYNINNGFLTNGVTGTLGEEFLTHASTANLYGTVTVYVAAYVLTAYATGGTSIAASIASGAAVGNVEYVALRAWTGQDITAEGFASSVAMGGAFAGAGHLAGMAIAPVWRAASGYTEQVSRQQGRVEGLTAGDNDGPGRFDVWIHASRGCG